MRERFGEMKRIRLYPIYSLRGYDGRQRDNIFGKTSYSNLSPFYDKIRKFDMNPDRMYHQHKFIRRRNDIDNIFGKTLHSNFNPFYGKMREFDKDPERRHRRNKFRKHKYGMYRHRMYKKEIYKPEMHKYGYKHCVHRFREPINRPLHHYSDYDYH